MATKEEFYKEFSSLHRNRIDAFFEKEMTKDEFISKMLCVFVEGLSIKDVLSPSVEASKKISGFLECDLYGAELIDINYVNGEFTYVFEIQIFSDNDDDEFELTFFLSNNSQVFDVKNEEIYFNGDKSKFWERMNKRVKVESTFGTLKRY